MRLLTICCFAFLCQPAPAATNGRVIDAGFHHLGDNVVKEWTEAPADPAGFTLEIRFEGRANSSETTLGLTHRDVDQRWALKLNGRSLGELKRKKARGEYYYPVPGGTLKDGENILAIAGIRTKDDITIGNATLYDATLRELLHLRPVTVSVTDAADGAYLPARITVTDATNGLVEIFHAESPKTAVRRGVFYTLGEPAQFEVPPGTYRIHATHGTEWSMGSRSLRVTEAGASPVEFALRRELDTAGFIAADTHIHTLTFSGHGDSSVEERMVTLAAEGVELAVATDHNHQTDYRPYQARMGLNERFTSVTGNEVTTRNGHFNSFPLPPGSDIPPYKEDDWVKLVDGIRAKGARVVVLNHPRWPDIARGPFGRFGLNRASGERAAGGAFTFDAMELINSGTLQPDPLFLCRDWFALLNHGEKVTAVGSSDSHTVGNIVGQGRTYVRSRTDVPSRIDIDEACDAFLAGRTTVSLGIIAHATVNETHQHGDLVATSGAGVKVSLRVQAPSWVKPKRAILYVNGEAAAEIPVPTVKAGSPTDVRLRLDLPPSADDAWMVCVVLGDAVTNPAWATEENYTFAATTPIYLDADGDGRCASPRETAAVRLREAGADPEQQWRAIAAASDAVAVQMVSQLRVSASPSSRVQLDKRIRAAASERAIFGEFLRYAPTK